MSWQPEVDEIQRRRKRALEMGGSEAVAKQHERGRLTVRERIEALVDRDSFSERGQIAGTSNEADGSDFRPVGPVVGNARIEGRPVVVCGDDFTVGGGAYTPAVLKKGNYAERLAANRRVPFVRLLEAGGASIAGGTGGGTSRGRTGYDWTEPPIMNFLTMQTMQSVPVVCIALGPVAGFPAGRLVSSHLSIMTKKTAQVLTGGPAVVAYATKQQLTKEELGSAKIHGRNGMVDNVAADEQDALRQARQFLSYLPSHRGELPPYFDVGDRANRRAEELLSIVPRERRRAFKMRKLIEHVMDERSFFEMGKLWGRSQITGLARVDGHPVGVMANDCYHDGGSMTADGADKIRRFVELCDLFHLPIVSFVDEPGFLIGAEAERAGTIRAGMNALFTVFQTTVPWFTCVVRRSYGVAQGIHLGPSPTVVAWPSAVSGALPIESGVQLAFRREIEAAPDPDARRAELEAEMAVAHSVMPRTEDFGTHDLIDPRETRPILCEWVQEIQTALVEHARQPAPRYSIRP
ncbi:MAG: propionyl-CoA carboxylase [Deltaproteobacteria bacterium]|jgi:acetyl-CoA carboxylase carboxyltransferase component|nr:propionyl-CoA carboxylase [Deltaproteobacteria bacterium]